MKLVLGFSHAAVQQTVEEGPTDVAGEILLTEGTQLVVRNKANANDVALIPMMTHHKTIEINKDSKVDEIIDQLVKGCLRPLIEGYVNEYPK